MIYSVGDLAVILDPGEGYIHRLAEILRAKLKTRAIGIHPVEDVDGDIVDVLVVVFGLGVGLGQCLSFVDMSSMARLTCLRKGVCDTLSIGTGPGWVVHPYYP